MILPTPDMNPVFISHLRYFRHLILSDIIGWSLIILPFLNKVPNSIIILSNFHSHLTYLMIFLSFNATSLFLHTFEEETPYTNYRNTIYKFWKYHKKNFRNTIYKFQKNDIQILETPYTNFRNTIYTFQKHHMQILEIPYTHFRNTIYKFQKYHIKFLETPFTNFRNTIYKFQKHHRKILETPYTNFRNTIYKFQKHHIQILETPYTNFQRGI